MSSGTDSSKIGLLGQGGIESVVFMVVSVLQAIYKPMIIVLVRGMANFEQDTINAISMLS